MRYNNFHKHTHYSNLRTLDCVSKPEDYCKRAVELGHDTYFTTEHGFQSNVFEAQTLCEKYNLKPIYGVEAYYVDDIENKSDRRNFHIVLIALTEKARYEINKIMSIANTDGFYYKPRIGLKELLSLTPTDTVVTTACVASRMFKPKSVEVTNEIIGWKTEWVYDSGPGYVDTNGHEEKKPVYKTIPIGEDSWKDDFLIPLYNHFKGNFFLEVQAHPQDIQIEYNKKIMEVHREYNIPIIHANDSHYVYPEQAKYRNLFLKAKDIVYEDEDEFILDYPDSDVIYARYAKQGVLTREEVTEALENTLVFDKAQPLYTDKEFKIPNVPDKFIQEELGDKFNNKDNDKVLREIIGREFQKRKRAGQIKESLESTYVKEIVDEVETVRQCGMAGYFVLDHVAVKRAVDKYGAVLTRSGRGSAVSFVINNFLGLTEVDRIKAPTRLYPSRFMSAERILSSRSLPDIDLNFADVAPVIQATKDILGNDGVYYMVAYKPLQRSSAFRLWCKAIGKDLSEYDEVAKLLSDKSYTDEMFIEQNPEFIQEFEDSKILRGVIESVAPSPCSFLLSNDPISEKIGLIKVGDEICCCLDGYNCDVYKFLKNDYLTVTVYSIIDRVYKMIGRPIDDIATLVNNSDDKVWDLYAKGLTTSINQVDSDMGKQLIMKYKPRNLAELAAWVAAIRPGFASLLKYFLNREEYTTGVEELDNLLQDSYHYMLYQESIMAFLVWLGIEEKGTYDIIKKIAKKKFKEEELQELKDTLLKNWIKNVGTEEHFEDNWQVVQDAASYSFNASHALSVAIDSLYGAYLKSHYPLEYFTVALDIYQDDTARTANLTKELSEFGIKMAPVQFGKSGSKYTCDKETNTIYKGVASIKYCNDTIGDQLLELSKLNFVNFADVLSHIKTDTNVNAKQLGILIGLKYFKDYGYNKYLLKYAEIYDELIERKQIKKSDIPDLNRKFGITENMLRIASGKETEKLFKDLDMTYIINKVSELIPNKPFSISEQVAFEMKYLEYVDYKNPDVSDKFYIITDFKTFSNPHKPYINLYRVKDGENIRTKVKKDEIYLENPFRLYSILKIDNFELKYKSEKVGDKWVKTDKLEPILSEYEIISI